MERPFHLRVFGPPALLDPDGRVLKFRTKKQLALLVYLSVHRDGGGVSRDQLVDLLWHDVEPKRGRHSLSQGLSVIRGVLGPDAIVTIGNRLSLSASLQTDVELLGRNGGVDADLDHPLQDLEDCSGVDFAHWVDAARQSILTATRATLLRVLQQARTRGETRTVHQLALRLHSVDPLSEVAVQTLAERLLLDGDAGGASRMLRGFLARASRLGSGANHTNLRRLIERIESDALPVNDILPERLKQKSSDTAELFVGRTREFGELEAVWEQAKAGSLRMCLMSGVAGIGKTSLIRQFSTSIASRGNLAVTIRCEEIGKAVPFAALADLIEELSKNPPLSGTDPHWLAEASRIAPALRVRYPGLPTPDQAPGESVRLRVAEALYRMLETVAEGLPLLIAIDDFQHLDQASRDVLHIVTRRLSDHASMVLGATRVEGFHSTSLSERPSSDLGTWHSKLELSPLSFEEGSTLVAELTQDLESEPHCGRIRRRIAKLAEGNPYFLEMLVSDWKAHRGESLAAAQGEGDLANTKWRPPDTLRLTFSRHYEGLLPMGRQIFELLAVAGRAMNASELGDLLGIASKKASQVVLEIIERAKRRARSCWRSSNAASSGWKGMPCRSRTSCIGRSCITPWLMRPGGTTTRPWLASWCGMASLTPPVISRRQSTSCRRGWPTRRWMRR
jgi:DNA-binding SARP family transcriptional activator